MVLDIQSRTVVVIHRLGSSLVPGLVGRNCTEEHTGHNLVSVVRRRTTVPTLVPPYPRTTGLISRTRGRGTVLVVLLSGYLLTPILGGFVPHSVSVLL